MRRLTKDSKAGGSKDNKVYTKEEKEAMKAKWLKWLKTFT